MGGWFQITLWKRVMLGLAVGVIVGLTLHYSMGEKGAQIATDWIRPFGTAFINLIRMLVVPLIFTTLVAGVTAMGDPAKLGSLGGRTIGLYLMTTLFAVSLGLIFGTIIQPGAGFDVSSISSEDVAAQKDRLDSAASATLSLTDRLLNIIPTNPVQALVNADVLQIIFFAIIFGVGCLLAKEAGKPISNAIESASEVMMKITHLVMETAPLGVFALITWVMATQGLGVLTVLGKMVFALYLACAVHMLITFGSLIKFVLRLPLIRFIRGIADAQAVAYSTSSSSATLPVTITCAEDNLGVKKSVAGSVLPLGATINMDGTALYQGLIALFAVQAFGLDISITEYFMIALTATLVSIGTAGIPSVSLFLAPITLGVVGCTPDQIAIILAVLFPFDRLLDMMRTVTNITGDSAVATAVAKWEGELDEEVYRTPAVV